MNKINKYLTNQSRGGKAWYHQGRIQRAFTFRCCVCVSVGQCKGIPILPFDGAVTLPGISCQNGYQSPGKPADFYITADLFADPVLQYRHTSNDMFWCRLLRLAAAASINQTGRVWFLQSYISLSHGPPSVISHGQNSAHKDRAQKPRLKKRHNTMYVSYHLLL